MSDRFSPLPSCFRPTATTSDQITPDTAAPPQTSGNPKLTTTTCLYHTDHGLFTLTWSTTLLSGHSLHLHHHKADQNPSLTSPLSLSSSPSFHLHIKPFIFWRKKRGSKKLTINQTSMQIFWDFKRAKFKSGSEPESGFFIAVVINGEMGLLVGDSIKEAYARTRAAKPKKKNTQTLLLRRENVFGNRIYKTKAKIGGKTREISIESNLKNEDPRLVFSIDNKRVLQVKHLKWKFRGNEKIEADDGVPIQVSWDVYNWLFEVGVNNNRNHHSNHAVFMFKFEKQWYDEDYKEEEIEKNENGGLMCGFEGIHQMGKKSSRSLLKTQSLSSSSISSSSGSSGCSSSVLEWASMEEKELENTSGFSLLVYAWKS